MKKIGKFLFVEQCFTDTEETKTEDAKTDEKAEDSIPKNLSQLIYKKNINFIAFFAISVIMKL